MRRLKNSRWLRGLLLLWCFAAPAAVAAPPPPPPVGTAVNGTQQADGFTADNIQSPTETVSEGAATITVRAFDKPLQIADIKVVELVKTSNGVNAATSVDTALLDLSSASNCVKIIAANKSCQFQILLSQDADAAAYRARIAIASSEFLKAIEVKISHRSSWQCALGILVIGLVVGAIVAYWLGGTRDQAIRAVRIKRVRANLTALTSIRHDGLKKLQASLIEVTRRWEGAIDRVVDLQVDELEKRPRQLEFLCRTLKDSPLDNAPLNNAIFDVAQAMSIDPEGALVSVDPTLFNQLRTAARPGAAIEAALPSIAPPTLPFTVTASVASALTAFRLVEHVVAFVLAVIFAAIAMNAFYFKDLAWGSISDKVSLFLVGFGAYAGSIASVGSFLGKGKTVSF